MYKQKKKNWYELVCIILCYITSEKIVSDRISCFFFIFIFAAF